MSKIEENIILSQWHVRPWKGDECGQVFLVSFRLLDGSTLRLEGRIGYLSVLGDKSVAKLYLQSVTRGKEGEVGDAVIVVIPS